MSITVTTDVFCDGRGGLCGDWVGQVTGPTSQSKEARKVAKANGWLICSAGDFCPVCRYQVQDNLTNFKLDIDP